MDTTNLQKLFDELDLNRIDDPVYLQGPHLMNIWTEMKKTVLSDERDYYAHCILSNSNLRQECFEKLFESITAFKSAIDWRRDNLNPELSRDSILNTLRKQITSHTATPKFSFDYVISSAYYLGVYSESYMTISSITWVLLKSKIPTDISSEYALPAYNGIPGLKNTIVKITNSKLKLDNLRRTVQYTLTIEATIASPTEANLLEI